MVKLNLEKLIIDFNTIHNTEEFRKEHGFDHYDYSLAVYVNSDTPIKIICNKCKIVFEQITYNHKLGQGCKFCGIKKCSLTKTYTNEEFLKRAFERHGNEFDYLEPYIGSKILLKAKHNRCGRIFFLYPCIHITRGIGCPYCKESYGEKKIKKWLILKNVNFDFNKRFDDCRNKKPLPFDFYLTKYNVCVEFDGPQHFEPQQYLYKTTFSKENSTKIFESQKFRDEIKNEYCKSKNIPLIRIPYWEFDNIEIFLENELIKLGIFV